MRSSFQVDRRCPIQGFTLVELLIVVTVLGVLATTGIRFFSGATQEASLRATSDSLQAFFQACRQRAQWRGIPVQITISNRVLTVSGAPSLFCPLPPLRPESRTLLESLRFLATDTIIGSRIIRDIPLSFEIPGNLTASLTIILGRRP